MKTKFPWFLLLIVFLVFQSSSIIATDKSSCLTCHTDDAVMKLLYKPPAMGPSEGEG